MRVVKILLLSFGVSLISCNSNAQNKMEQIRFSKTFISNFKDYKMDIQAAGIASIPVATLSEDDKIYVEYSYKSGSENRNGQMTLSLNSENKRFEGSWKTLADNGNSYQGDLYFVFEADGQATGFYQFSDVDYKITIFKP